MKNKGKNINNKKSKNKYIAILFAIVLSLGIYYIFYWKGSRWGKSFSDIYSDIPPMNFWQIFIIALEFMAILLFFIVMGILLRKKPIIANKIEKTFEISWKTVILPLMIFMIMFLGWYQNHYQYESHFQENMTQAFCTLGNVTTTIYHTGANISGYAWIIIFIGFIWIGYESIKDVWEEKQNDGKSKKRKD